MATVKGGDIKQLVVKGRELTVKGGDANVNIDVGGYTNEGGLDGNGKMAITQRRKVAGFSDCPVRVDDPGQDLEFLQGIANDGEPVPVTITLATNVVYGGDLAVVGDLAKATGDGILTLEMRGARFEQI